MNPAGFIITRENLKKPRRKGKNPVHQQTGSRRSVQSGKIYKERAWSALEAGIRQEAIAYWQKAIKADTGNKQAK
jgi:hypothetical protein